MFQKLKIACGGFSLIEVLVAVLITATVVLGFSTGTLAVMKTNRLSERYSRACAIAQDQMARLRADIALGPLAAGSRTVDGHQVQWALTAPPAGASADLTGVLLTVTWQDSTTHTLTFRTVFGG